MINCGNTEIKGIGTGYYAQDADGFIAWYDSKPNQWMDRWIPTSKMQFIKVGKPNKNWNNSLVG